jgi:Helix-turn-helix of DDE superfamily endonuclease
MMLAPLRKGETSADLAAGIGVSTATVWRYVRETVALLAARARTLHTALKAAKKAGHAVVVIDGTLTPWTASLPTGPSIPASTAATA